MALKINASSLVTNHYLKLDSNGVDFAETSVGGSRHFFFRDISCILMSADSTLSFQVGKEVFSIPTKPGNEKHQTVIETLVSEVRRANGATQAGN
jgi:hypothetical protein